MREKLKLGTGALVVLAVIGACAGGGIDSGVAADSGEQRGVEGGRKGFAYDTDDPALEAAGQAAGGTRTAARGVSLPPIGPAVIKTGELGLRVDARGLQAALDEIVEVARTHGGFVLSTSVEERGARSGTVVIRVPAERFEVALADARAIGEVLHEQVSGEDVSQEFVDLDARLRNFEAQESVLLDLMAKSATVADTLRVQRELQDVQLEIERLRGRLRYLRDQTDLSTITVSLREEEPVVAATGLLERAWKRALDTFSAIVSAIVVGLSVVIPIGIFVVLALLIARLLRLRLPSWGSRDA